MWKRERTSMVAGLADSRVTWPTRWLVSHSGACDQAFGCEMRPLRISIISRSSAKIDGDPSHSVCSRVTGIQ
jgi:hypothetical protein